MNRISILLYRYNALSYSMLSLYAEKEAALFTVPAAWSRKKTKISLPNGFGIILSFASLKPEKPSPQIQERTALLLRFYAENRFYVEFCGDETEQEVF